MPETTDPDNSRRTFLNWLLGSSAGVMLTSIFYPLFRFISPPRIPEATTRQVEAGTTNDPELVEKGYKIVRFGSEPVILVKVADTEFRAFSATCTHLDCIVEYQKGEKRFWCNCHNGEYDLQGRQVGGPPPRPLSPYSVALIPSSSGQPNTIVVSKA